MLLCLRMKASLWIFAFICFHIHEFMTLIKHAATGTPTDAALVYVIMTYDALHAVRVNMYKHFL